MFISYDTYTYQNQDNVCVVEAGTSIYWNLNTARIVHQNEIVFVKYSHSNGVGEFILCHVHDIVVHVNGVSIVVCVEKVWVVVSNMYAQYHDTTFNGNIYISVHNNQIQTHRQILNQPPHQTNEYLFTADVVLLYLIIDISVLFKDPFMIITDHIRYI